MRANLAATSALIVAAVSRGATAQQLEPRPVPSRDVVAFTYQSPSMGVRYGISVGLPLDYAPSSGRKYPALITTDGDRSFIGVYDAARSLMDEKAIQDLFIVSIGSELQDSDTSWIRRRVYEFSPANWDLKDPFGQAVSAVCRSYRSEPGRCVGGAPQFLNAIVTEILPLVLQKYPIDPDQLGLFGISAGGFFASWTIFQRNAPFRKYLISSPAMAYGDDQIYREEAGYAAEHKDLKAGIYFGAGSLEIQGEFFEAVGHIVSGMSRLAGLLRTRHYPGLTLVTEIHPGMSHNDVMGTSVVRGLRSLYPSGRPEVEF